MAAYLISYDLIKRKDYPELINALEKIKDCRKIHLSTWVVETTSSAEEVFKYLAPHIDDDDRLIVLGLNGDGWGRKNVEGGELTWDWLKGVLSRNT